MKRSLVRTVIGLATAVVASLLLLPPAGGAEGDDVQRLHCFFAGDENYRVEGCAGYVLNKDGKHVATGFADDAGAGEPGYSTILVKVTNVRMQTFLCGGTRWVTSRRRPDLDGWWARDHARTKPLPDAPGDHRYRAKATVTWKYPDGTNRHTRTIATRPKGTCP